MGEPAYISIAAEYARMIRSGSLQPGTQFRSLNELVTRHGVSKIVIIQAIQLLERQGLVRTVPRRGTFVTDHPNLVRVAPELQTEGLEDACGRESAGDARAERESRHVAAPAELADAFAIAIGDSVIHTVTRTTEDGRPVSISDTYRPTGAPDLSAATVLEECVADRLPSEAHAAWLRTSPGDLVKTVRRQWLGPDDSVLALSEISFPRDRYDAFVFRMELTQQPRQLPPN
ncbi:GntR family transcriptional regulator [Nocardia noduli]|uniref:GntR family transcriptional regulator n=1 Tax=Nocardia noduli TaxID=2815722 RepID=UPI001C22449F|nr:GntR family transcriptional regulator [Nocardia noduli]